MSHADFIHLRVHSAYSLSEGAIRVKELVELCRIHRMPAVAVTDSGNLFGALEFAVAAAEAGVQPVIGVLLGIAEPEPATVRRPRPEPAPVLLLAQNGAGYRNLLDLVSAAFLESMEGEAPHVGWARLKGCTEGLIALTGGPAGPVGRALADGKREEARGMLRRLAQLFPGRTYVEVMRHNRSGEEANEAALIDLAYELDLPLVATNDVHFAEEADFEAHDVLVCIAKGRRVEDEDRPRLTPEHRFKTAAEMRTLFADLPEAVDNTLAVAQRCAFMPKTSEPLLPAFDRDGDEADLLRRQAREGLEERLGDHGDEAGKGTYRERLEYELDMIIRMKFAGYFLIVSEFITWAKGQGIPVGPGRGSGAGSVVAWALSITDLDPLRWGLLFERFLNPERISMPDFDIDFCQDRRDEVIHHVQERYGTDRVAQIITFGTLQARAALRDVGRVLGLPYGQVDKLCKLVPYNPAKPPRLAEVIEGEPAFRAMRDEDENVARLIDVATSLEGLYRHASTHAAGVVIADRPLHEVVPLYRDPRSEMPVTQFNMKWTEEAGLVKFDFLGLKTLTVLEDARCALAARGIEIDLLQLPLDDGRTFGLLSGGDTAGVFQLEGSGMRDMLRKLKPNRFEDIIAVVALYRPGPMENIPSYIARKHGQEEVRYPHPWLQEVLEETYGIIIYQEQVMQIAQVLAGYTLGGADLLRRAMGKKKQDEMDAQRETFVEGAVAKGVDRDRAVSIFDLVDKFAGYGFNKSHAAAYALIAYQTAYLKANHPVEFMAASMTHDMGNTDKLNAYRRELDRLGITLLPPDLQRSGVAFAAEELDDGRKAIRFALAAVKSVGRAAVEELVRERSLNGPFADPFDFAGRLGPRVLNTRLIESLAAAGAFDGIEPNRARVMAGAEMLMRHGAVEQEERTSNQGNLFGGEGGDAVTAPKLPEVGDWRPEEALRQEFDVLGLYLSAHPIDQYAGYYERLNLKRIDELPDLVNKGVSRARIAGTMIAKQERTSQRGARFAFVMISDSSGQQEVRVFAETFETSRLLLDGSVPLLFTCDLAADGEDVRLSATKIEPLQAAVSNTGTGLRIFVDDGSPLDRIRALLQREPEGRGQVDIVLDMDRDHEVRITLQGGVSVTPGILAELKAIRDIVDVREV